MSAFDRIGCLVSLIIFVLVFNYFKNKKISMYDPRQMYLLSNIVSLSLLSIGHITYQEVFTMNTLLYYLLFSTMFVMACSLAVGNRKIPLAPQVFSVRQPKVDSVFKGFFVFGLLYVALTFADVLAGLSQVAGGGLAEVRNEFMGDINEAGAPGVFRVLISVLKASTFLAALYLPFAIIRGQRLRFFISSFFFIYLSLSSIAIGGRAIIGYLSFTCVILYYSYSLQLAGPSPIIRTFKKLLLVMLGVLFLYLVFGVFMSARNENLIGEYNLYLGFQQHAKFSTWFEKIADGNHGLLSFAYGMTYLTSSLPGFTMLMGDTLITESYLMGTQSFDVAAKGVSLLSGENASAIGRETIAYVVSSNGLFATNPWATFMRDLVMDFGLIGGIIAISILGYCIMRVYIFGLNSRYWYGTCCFLFMSLSAFVMPLRGPFNLTTISNCLVVLALIYIFTNTKRKKNIRVSSNKKGGRGNVFEEDRHV